MNESDGRWAFGSQGERVLGLRQKGPHEAQAQCCPTLALQNETTAWRKSINKETSYLSRLGKGKLDVELHL